LVGFFAFSSPATAAIGNTVPVTVGLTVLGLVVGERYLYRSLQTQETAET